MKSASTTMSAARVFFSCSYTYIHSSNDDYTNTPPSFLSPGQDFMGGSFENLKQQKTPGDNDCML